LEHQRERLAEDHENAQQLAEGLQSLKGVLLEPESVETNIVNFDLPGRSAAEVAKGLAQRDVAVLATGPERIRAVTNLMVSRAQIGLALDAIAQELKP